MSSSAPAIGFSYTEGGTKEEVYFTLADVDGFISSLGN